MKRFSVLLGLALFLALTSLTVVTLLAQEDDCAALVESILETLDNVCEATGSDQVCLGSLALTAESRPDATDFTFATPGDIVNAADIETLASSGLDTEAENLGIALAKLQAGLPVDSSLLVLIFGDVEMQNAVAPVGEVTTLELTALQSANVRAYPSTDGRIVGSLTNGQIVTTDGRVEDNSWLRITLEDGTIGWVFNELVSGDAEADVLAVIDPDVPFYGPLQNFTFQTTNTETSCADAPQSGILVQTPEGANRVKLGVNGTMIEFIGTLFLQAGDELVISVIEGQALVEVNGSEAYLPAGAQVFLTLGDDGLATGAPTDIRAYDEDGFTGLPLVSLGRDVEIAPPFDPASIPPPTVPPPPQATQVPPQPGQPQPPQPPEPGQPPTEVPPPTVPPPQGTEEP